MKLKFEYHVQAIETATNGLILASISMVRPLRRDFRLNLIVSEDITFQNPMQSSTTDTKEES